MFGLGELTIGNPSAKLEGSMDSIATTLHSTEGTAGNFGINFGTAAKFIFETLSAKHPEHFIVSTKYEKTVYMTFRQTEQGI